MAIVYVPKNQEYVGLSTDSKAKITTEGSIIYYSDTKNRQILHGGVWGDYVVNTDTTLEVGDIEIGAVELKDSTTSNRASIDADGNLHATAITVFDTGIATSGSKTTIVDTSKNYPTNLLADKTAEVIVDGITYLRNISSNTVDTITIDTLPGTEAYASIGAGGNGVVTITSDTEDDLWNTYTVEAVAASTDNHALTAAFVGTNMLITLGTDNGDKADTTIGSGANGTVTVEVDVAGSAGNNYTVAVDASLVTPDRALGSTLVGNDLVVLLATEADAKANSTIGSGDNGAVSIEVDVAGSGGNSYTVAVTDDLSVQDLALGSTLIGNALTVILATEADAKANVNIGTGANGTVNVEVDAAGTSGNAFTVVVNDVLTTQDRALSSALVGDALTVYLATEGNAKANTTIGSGDNGTVSVEVDAPGTDGNDFTVTVDATLTTQRALSATEVAGDLTVYLATEGDTKANTTIGAGENGVVTVEVDAPGTNGHAYTIAVDDTITAERVLDTSLVGSDLVVLLATEGSVKATADIGAGENGVVTIEVDIAGTNGNAYTVAVNADLTEQDRVLDTTLIANDLIVLLATEGDVAASTTIGAGENGTVTITADNGGTDGNDYTVTVIVGTGDLSADLDGNDLTVTLPAAGDTATNVALAIAAKNGITAVASGTGADSLTLAVNKKNFTNGTNKLHADANTATLVAAEINANHAALLTATPSGNGSTALSVVEVEKSFANGANIVNTTTNTATLISAEINTNHGATFTATASGTGATNISVAEVEKHFANATNKVHTTANTATLVAGAINAGTTTLTSVASGTGASSLTGAEVQKNFANGTNKLKNSANTATLVAGSVNNDTAGLTAVASGNGTSPITSGEVLKNFANGTNKLHADANTATLIAARINGTHGATFTATASGTGATALIGENIKSFANGTNKIHTTSNTATLVTARINDTHGALLTATASGDGSSSLTNAVAEKHFTGGGLNPSLDNAKNTATLVAGVVTALPNFSAVASGNGSTAISATAPVAFTSGIDPEPVIAGCDYRILTTKQADGGDITFGAKADAAVTDPALSGTFMSFVKGILSTIKSVITSSKVQVDVKSQVALSSTTDSVTAKIDSTTHGTTNKVAADLYVGGSAVSTSAPAPVSVISNPIASTKTIEIQTHFAKNTAAGTEKTAVQIPKPTSPVLMYKTAMTNSSIDSALTVKLFNRRTFNITGTGFAAGSDATHIQLAATANPTNDHYNTFVITITAGTGAGQTRTISDYVGATQIAEVSQAWVTAPGDDSVYSIALVRDSLAWTGSFAKASLTAPIVKARDSEIITGLFDNGCDVYYVVSNDTLIANADASRFTAIFQLIPVA